MDGYQLCDIIHRVPSAPWHFGLDGIVYCGDNTKVLPAMPDQCADLVVTDPPYGVGWRSGIVVNDTPDASVAVFVEFIRQVRRILKPGGCCCCLCSSSNRALPVFMSWLDVLRSALIYKKTLIWDKCTPGLGTHYRQAHEYILVASRPGAPCRWFGKGGISDILRCERVRSSDSSHPTPKPPSLISRLVSLHSQKGDIVLDPFCGSGSTLVAAKSVDRRFIGIDVVPSYIDEAVYRIGQVMAKKLK